MKSFSFLFLCFFIFGVARPVWGQDYNGIVFYPNVENRPSDQSFAVQADDMVPFCVNLEKLEAPFFKKIKNRVVGFRIVLEDQEVPPHKINVVWGHRHFKRKPDDDGCHHGKFPIPSTQAPGLYQVSDFFVVLDDNSFYSLRDYLFSFKDVDEIVVEGRKPDTMPPRLVGLGIFGPDENSFTATPFETVVVHPRYWVRLHEKQSGLIKKSLKAYFQIFLNGEKIDIIEVDCKPYAPEGMFVCKHKLKNLLEEWFNQELVVQLDSLVAEDRAGNRVTISMEEYLASIEPPPSLKITYTKKRPVVARSHRYLNKYVKKKINAFSFEEKGHGIWKKHEPKLEVSPQDSSQPAL